jgi:uncharacterized membrane protein YcaP (DUF421 family)
MDDPVIPFDWARMFLGDQPPLFLLEILFRTVFMYAYTLLLLRWIGGRSVAQLSVVEFLLVIALGSAVGDSLFYPDVPLVHAMLVITVVVVIDKLIDMSVRRWRTAKLAFNGRAVQLVDRGRILKDGTLDRHIGDLELMELLRLKGIVNLGEVQSAYMEPNGQLSVVRADPPENGLAIVPPWEIAPPPYPTANEAAVCVGCGARLPPEPVPCPHCGERLRTSAIVGARA